MNNQKAFSTKDFGNDNTNFLPMFRLYKAIMNAYRWETDEEADRFHNGSFEIIFTDGDGNKTSYKDGVCPYTFEAITDALESMAEEIQFCDNVSPWLVQLFNDVKEDNETFICK